MPEPRNEILTNDDSSQAALARTILETGDVWIAKTVVLETAWVLRSVYRFDNTAVYAALALAEKGLDFADSLHLCSRPAGVVFASFDKAFIGRAKRAGVTNVKHPA